MKILKLKTFTARYLFIQQMLSAYYLLGVALNATLNIKYRKVLANFFLLRTYCPTYYFFIFHFLLSCQLVLLAVLSLGLEQCKRLSNICWMVEYRIFSPGNFDSLAYLVMGMWLKMARYDQLRLVRNIPSFKPRRFIRVVWEWVTLVPRCLCTGVWADIAFVQRVTLFMEVWCQQLLGLPGVNQISNQHCHAILVCGGSCHSGVWVVTVKGLGGARADHEDWSLGEWRLWGHKDLQEAADSSRTDQGGCWGRNWGSSESFIGARQDIM